MTFPIPGATKLAAVAKPGESVRELLRRCCSDRICDCWELIVVGVLVVESPLAIVVLLLFVVDVPPPDEECSCRPKVDAGVAALEDWSVVEFPPGGPTGR